MVVMSSLPVKGMEFVGLILWIDDNQFAAGLLEKVFKKRHLPFYHLAQVKDFSYLVDDLKPEIIVLDSATALKDLESFKQQYQQSSLMRTIPVVILGAWDNLDFIEQKLGQLERKFDPFSIPDKLKAFGVH